MTQQSLEYDYIVVGSGAGGGPLAANLAKRGYRVCLMEAGKRPPPQSPNYDVPVFHTAATEDPALGWFKYVRHYTSDAIQQRDDKYHRARAPDPEAPQNGDPGPPYRYPRWQSKDGVFYPRASTVGGCTAHHALITVYPHNSDWREIVEFTGDWTWNPENMRRYFQEIEHCDYRRVWKFINRWFKWNPTRHGFNGWLPTKVANPKLLVRDKQLFRLLFDSATEALFHVKATKWRRVWNSLKNTANALDYNAWKIANQNSVGIFQTALSVNGVKRSAVREYVEQVESRTESKLTIKTGVLVEKVLFEEEPDEAGDWVATGVQYYEGYDLYEAAANYDPKAKLGPPRQMHAKREVILACGAFTTPQVLMLSGIGDHEYLRQVGMPEENLRVHAPGVGRNLQDRYEVGLVQTMKQDFSTLNRARLAADPNDPLYVEWTRGVDGAYATNGAVISIIKKSTPDRELPDLYIFGVIGPFAGYDPGYSAEIRETHREFTWVILKAHPDDISGKVELNQVQPLDPRRVPHVNVKYFNDGKPEDSRDLEALVAGVKFVRKMTRAAREVISEERYPGQADDEVPTHDEAKIREWIVNNAWGHHASCTCPMGLRSHMHEERGQGYLSVLDGKFRVFGTKNLRVVDASVFPKIPGFFIVLPIYMASQKAAEQIALDAESRDRREGVV